MAIVALRGNSTNKNKLKTFKQKESLLSQLIINLIKNKQK